MRQIPCDKRSFRYLTYAAFLFVVAVASAEDQIDYTTQIKPLLAEKCYSCHSALKQEAGLRLETRELMLEGGDSGPSLVSGDASKSLLIERLAADVDERMPPADAGARLKPAEVKLIAQWIAQGAKTPHEDIPEAPSAHWAFQRIEKPLVSKLEVRSNVVHHPIDSLLDEQRQKHSLRTQPEAERSILIRRLYLDLIGLPPTREQLLDRRPWEQIVDELLDSPHHGERWARHWMDIWRYTDWYGLGAQLRNSQKHIWHWRDWIVESLNDDKGYDRMIQEMLAGDELAPTDLNTLRATGFLARNYYLFNRTTWLDSTIEHTGKAFLGLTLNCGKCHDHKYDPISQVDYYRLRAIFEPHQVRLDPIPGVIDLEKDGIPRVFDDHLDAKTSLHIRGNPKTPDNETEITPGVPAILASFAPAAEPVELPFEAFAPGTRDYVRVDRLAAARQKVETADEELQSARKLLKDTPKPDPKSKPAPDVPPAFDISDDFAEPNPELWELIGDGWEYRDGALHQTTPTRDRVRARLKKQLPRDFEVTCRYTTTGGTTYKSVTFRFDESDNAKNSNFIYTSAHAPGPKVHAAYTRGGSTSYPNDGRVPRAIKVGEPLELRFAVRDTLINVWLNGDFLLAWRYPDRLPGGQFSMSGFDATVAFDSVSIRSLPADVKMTESKSGAPSTPTDAEFAVKLAEARLTSAVAAEKSLRAIIAADDAKFTKDSSGDEVTELTRTAAVLQAEARIAAAEFDILNARNDASKKKAAESRLAQAKKKLAASAEGEPVYESIRASRKALETPAHQESQYSPVYSERSTGRRTAFARWVTSRDNPLTARVAVNHVWLRHFGEPLVESVFDFGLRAKRPLHAKLLDYLAADLMESGWSFKRLHRLIVTSQAYRMSSSSANAHPGTAAADPTNRFYWRMNTRRMEAQTVRDSLLHLSGSIDLTLGGPSINPKQGGTRRSLYFQHSRDQQDQFLKMFDDADHLQCYRRSESIVPQQALALSNSKLSHTSATDIEKRITATLTEDDREAFIRESFFLLLGRHATPDESVACREFFDQIAQLRTTAGSPPDGQRARRQFIHSLLNHNDFVSIR